MIGGRGQTVLVGPAVDDRTGELLGSCVVHCSQCDVGVGEPADLGGVAGDSEVRQQNPTPAAVRSGEQNVGRLNVAMEQTTTVRVVECVRHRRDDLDHVGGGHSGGIVLAKQLSGVRTINVVH